jgi:[acyl-carrier-protein] S-malonyltransferase
VNILMNDQQSNLAFVFPGQGSQSVGMLTNLAENYPEVKHVFEQASDVLSFDIWKLIQEGPVEALNKTQNTQPIMLAAGVATWQVWCNQTNSRPQYVAGHSLGEYTALVAAEALTFEDAILLVAERGRLMQEAVPEGIGAMAAILGLTDEQVVTICEQTANGEVVSAVNFNSPGQVVIAGHVGAVDRAMVAAKDAGAKRALLLPVSVPSHCALMEPAANQLADVLNPIVINSPKMTLIHNVDAAAHSDTEMIKSLLKSQLSQPVRWVQTVQHLQNQEVEHFIECGPGKVLMSLNKRIAKGRNHLAILDSSTLENVLETVND